MSKDRRVPVSGPMHAMLNPYGSVSFLPQYAARKLQGDYAEISPQRFIDGDRANCAPEDATFWALCTRDLGAVRAESFMAMNAPIVHVADFVEKAEAASYGLAELGRNGTIRYAGIDNGGETVVLKGEYADLTARWADGAVIEFSGPTDHGLATFDLVDTAEYRAFMERSGLKEKPHTIDWIMVGGVHIDGQPELAEEDARKDFLESYFEEPGFQV